MNLYDVAVILWASNQTYIHTPILLIWARPKILNDGNMAIYATKIIIKSILHSSGDIKIRIGIYIYISIRMISEKCDRTHIHLVTKRIRCGFINIDSLNCESQPINLIRQESLNTPLLYDQSSPEVSLFSAGRCRGPSKCRALVWVGPQYPAYYPQIEFCSIKPLLTFWLWRGYFSPKHVFFSGELQLKELPMVIEFKSELSLNACKVWFCSSWTGCDPAKARYISVYAHCIRLRPW